MLVKQHRIIFFAWVRANGQLIITLFLYSSFISHLGTEAFGHLVVKLASQSSLQSPDFNSAIFKKLKFLCMDLVGHPALLFRAFGEKRYGSCSGANTELQTDPAEPF